MSEKPISPLRQRMIEDMSVRNFIEKTRNDYIRHVCTFTAFLGRSPDTAGPEDLRTDGPFCRWLRSTGCQRLTRVGSVVLVWRSCRTLARSLRSVQVCSRLALAPRSRCRRCTALPSPLHLSR
jgi:hypothetical protein